MYFGNTKYSLFLKVVLDLPKIWTENVEIVLVYLFKATSDWAQSLFPDPLLKNHS